MKKYEMNELPILQGTEKQIAWAEKIRKQYMDAMETLKYFFTEEDTQNRGEAAKRSLSCLTGKDYMKELRGYLNETGKRGTVEEIACFKKLFCENVLKEAQTLIDTQGIASWWIDRR